MNVFRKLWQSVETLAASLNGLAATVESFSQEVRQRTVDANLPLLTDGDDHGPARLPDREETTWPRMIWPCRLALDRDPGQAG